MPALESLRTLIRTSTSSMTSVPKPLKFLRPFFGELQDLQASWDASSLSEEKVGSSILSANMRPKVRVELILKRSLFSLPSCPFWP